MLVVEFDIILGVGVGVILVGLGLGLWRMLVDWMGWSFCGGSVVMRGVGWWWYINNLGLSFLSLSLSLGLGFGFGKEVEVELILNLLSNCWLLVNICFILVVVNGECWLF